MRPGHRLTLEASHTFLECSPYCSTRGRMLVVTMRWALLKLWSISCSVRVMDCSSFSSSSVKVKFLDGAGRDILGARSRRVVGW